MRKVPTSRAPDCMTQKYIGSAYDHVKEVSENIDAVKNVSDHVSDILVTNSNSADISTVSNSIDKVITVSDGMPHVTAVALNIPDIAKVSTNIDEVVDVSNNMGHVITASTNMPAIIDAPAQAKAAKDSATDSANSATSSALSASKAEQHELASEANKIAAGNSASAALVSENNAKQSETTAGTYASKSEEIYEAFAKGSVYRGGWNPKVGAYPDALNINSYWDVYLDKNVPYIDWNGIRWYAGDRLIYSVPNMTYFHIQGTPGVASVNGKTGNAILVPDDIGAVALDGSNQMTGDLRNPTKGWSLLNNSLNIGKVNSNDFSALNVFRSTGRTVVSVEPDGGGARLVFNDYANNNKEHSINMRREPYEVLYGCLSDTDAGRFRLGMMDARNVLRDKGITAGTGGSYDLNDLVWDGDYTLSGSWANSHSGAAPAGLGGQISVYKRLFDAANSVTQKLMLGGVEYVRYGTGNPLVWSDWDKVFTTRQKPTTNDIDGSIDFGRI